MEYTVEVNDAPYTYISNSNIAGRGLFASINIEAGDIIVDFGNANYWKERPYESLTAAEKQRRWLVMIDSNTCLVSDKCSNFSFINHSLEPNAFVDLDNRRVVAWQPIAQGEEITLDYTAQPLPEGESFPNWE